MATELIVKVSAETAQFVTGIGQATKKTDELKSRLTKISAVAGVAFTGLIGGIGLSVKKFAEFDNQLKSVKTLLDENSFGAKGLEKGFSDLTKEVNKLGAQSPSSINELNQALFDTVSAGIDAGEAVEFLTAANKLAVAGLTDVSTATDGLTSAVNAYGLEAKDATKVSAKFFTAQKFGKTTIAELSRSFGLVASSANALGVDIDELLASVSAATAGSIKTNTAFTSLKALLSNIARPTAEATKEAKKLGIAFNAKGLRESGGLIKFFNKLKNSTNFTKDSIVNLFGSTEAQTLAFSLLGEQAEKLEEIYGALSNETQSLVTFNNAFEESNNSLQNQVGILNNKFETLTRVIGQQFAPDVQTATKLVGAFLDTLLEDEGFASAIAGVLKLTAAFLAGTTAAAGLGAAILLAVGSPVIAGISVAIGALAALGVAVANVVLKEDLVKIDELKNRLLKLQNAARIEENPAKLAFLKQQIKLTNEEIGQLETKIRLEKEASTLDRENYIERKDNQKNLADEALGQVDFVLGKKREAAQKEIEIEKAKQDKMKQMTEEQKAQKAAEDEADLEIKNQKAEAELAQRQIQIEREITDERSKQIELAKVRKDAQKKNLTNFKTNLKTRSELEKDDRNRRIGEINRENAIRVKEENQSNKQIAAANAFFRQNEVKNAQLALGNLSTLTQSNSKELFRIGKAAATASAIVNVAQGVTKALAQGGVFGPVLAASIIAAGAVQIATIKAQKFQGARDGAEVMGGTPGRDSVPFMLEPGELVNPKRNFNEVIGSVRAKREAEKLTGDVDESGPMQIDIKLDFNQNLVDFVETEIVARRGLQINQI